MTIVDAIVAEHTVFLGIFDHIDRILPQLTNPSEVRTLASLVEGMLQGHAAWESSVAYLALDHVLAEEGALNRMHQDHDEIDDGLKLVHSAKTCAEARGLLQNALNASRDHFRMEEHVVFPLLTKLLQHETLTELGRLWGDRNYELAMAPDAA